MAEHQPQTKNTSSTLVTSGPTTSVPRIILPKAAEETEIASHQHLSAMETQDDAGSATYGERIKDDASSAPYGMPIEDVAGSDSHRELRQDDTGCSTYSECIKDYIVDQTPEPILPQIATTTASADEAPTFANPYQDLPLKLYEECIRDESFVRVLAIGRGATAADPSDTEASRAIYESKV